MEPSLVSYSLLMVRMSVDLPAPERPMIATKLPSGMVRSMSFRASNPLGYLMYTWENSIMQNLLRGGMGRGRRHKRKGPGCALAPGPHDGKESYLVEAEPISCTSFWAPRSES